MILVFIGLILSCAREQNNIDIGSVLYPSKLQFGEYSVGLRTLWLYDESREAVPYADWSGKLTPTRESKGRQFQVNLWYPSSNKNPGKRLTLKNYLELSFRKVNFDQSEELSAFGKRELKSKLIDLGGLDTLSQEQYESLSSLRCMAVSNLDPIGARVPLILFPNGMSPVSISTTAEYLASHGYAVAGFSAMGKDSSPIDVSSGGIDTGVDDITYVLREILAEPFVDSKKVGLIGNAIESSFNAAYLSKNQTIKAYVSLEGGFLSNFEQTMLEKLPYYRADQIATPLLLIYSPHPAIDPTNIEKLEYADRYFAHLPGMREFDYLNFGLWDSLVPAVIGQTRGDVRAGFVASHTLIREYFDAVFEEELNVFEEAFLTASPAEIDTTFIWSSKPKLPSMAIVKDGFINKGIPYIDSIYNRQKKFVKTPFNRTFINDFINWVSWKKDPDYEARIWLMQKAVRDYPSYAIYSFDLAWYSQRQGDSLTAREQYREFLRKLPDDKDERLSAEEKSDLRSDALSQLKTLK